MKMTVYDIYMSKYLQYNKNEIMVRNKVKNMANITKKIKSINITDEIYISLNTGFEFSKNRYECKKTECFVRKIKGNSIYKVFLNCEKNGDIGERLIAVFISSEGKELARLHTENGVPFVTHPDTAEIKFVIIVFSRTEGSFFANDLKLLEIGENKKRQVRLAAVAVNYNSGERSFERNLNETLRAMENAGAAKPDIIAATECFYDRNVQGISLSEGTVSENGEVMARFRELAVKYNTYIAFSIHMFLENGNISNMGIIIGRDGKTVGKYNKTHISMQELEKGIEPGCETEVFDLDFGRVGMAICWDMFFPEAVRELHLKGAEVIINPTAGYEFERTAERAKESGAFILTSGTQAVGDTSVFDPDGRCLVKGEEGKDYIIADVDLSKQFYVDWLSCSSASTRKNVFRYERRPELYERGRSI